MGPRPRRTGALVEGADGVIRAYVKLASGQKVMFIGLDRENTKRLHDNQPIVFEPEVLPGLRVVILAGETLDDVREDLRALGINPE